MGTSILLPYFQTACGGSFLVVFLVSIDRIRNTRDPDRGPPVMTKDHL